MHLYMGVICVTRLTEKQLEVYYSAVTSVGLGLISYNLGCHVHLQEHGAKF